jgi:UDP-N-acetylglucosamine acyltransferase
MPQIHPTAVIEDGANIDPDARIGPFCIVESGAEIGPGCVLESNVRVYGQTRLGRDNIVCHGATIGSQPQDLSYTPDKAKPLVIGDGNHFKECVNISHGIKTDHGTRIGDNNYVMAFTHIGHDSIVGDHNVFATHITVAGHVTIGSRTFLSGLVAIHQFCRIGDYVMVGGVSGVRQDVPPFAMANGQYARFVGINLVGLRRAGFAQAQRSAIKKAYRVLLQSGLRLSDALAQVAADGPGGEVRQIITFIEQSERGVVSTG